MAGLAVMIGVAQNVPQRAGWNLKDARRGSVFDTDPDLDTDLVVCRSAATLARASCPPLF